jgi:hypothetical protein
MTLVTRIFQDNKLKFHISVTYYRERISKLNGDEVNKKYKFI